MKLFLTILRARRENVLALFLLVLVTGGVLFMPESAMTLEFIMDTAETLRTHPLAVFAVVAIYLVAGSVLVPATLMIAVTGAVFGPALGSLYAVTGVLVAAAVHHRWGRALGRRTVERLATSRLRPLLDVSQRLGALPIAAIRMLPLAPFVIVNMTAGALKVRLRDFLLGTFLGMGPGILLLTLLGESLENAARRPSAETWITCAIVAGILIAAAALVRRHAVLAVARLTRSEAQ